MKLDLEQVRCRTKVIAGTAIIFCNAHLFDTDPVNNYVVIKCWRCKSYHTYSFSKDTKLMVGDRILS